MISSIFSSLYTEMMFTCMIKFSLVTGLNNILNAYEDKSAYAMCIFSLSLGPNLEPVTFLGKTQVIISFLLPWASFIVSSFVNLLFFPK